MSDSTTRPINGHKVRSLNPYADEKGNPKLGKTVEWAQWLEENGDYSMDHLSNAEREQELAYRQGLQDRMNAERFPKVSMNSTLKLIIHRLDLRLSRLFASFR